MKKQYSLFIISCLLMMKVSGQAIIAFAVTPSSPTINDTIRVIVQCEFPSGGCDGSATFGGVSGNQITASAMHCLGMLTVICDDYDTVVIPPLSAGTYNLNFVLVTGQGIPCTPGGIPVVDSTHIIVSGVNGINNLNSDNAFRIFPNPTSGNFIVMQNADERSVLKIFSVEGKLINKIQLTDRETKIENDLSPGIYMIELFNENNRVFSKLIVNKGN